MFPYYGLFIMEAALTITLLTRKNILDVSNGPEIFSIITELFSITLSYIVQSLAQSCPTDSATPWTVAHQAPPSTGFSRQEYWTGLPFPSPGDLPDPGIEPRSPTLQADALTSEPPHKTI